MKNYYEILDASRDADTGQLKAAYRKLAQKWHPDKHQNSDKQEEAEEKFKDISEAYAVLSDEEKRRNYDATGSPDGPTSHGFRPGGFHTTGDLFEIFRQFGEFDFQTGPRSPRPMKGQNIQEIVEIPLEDALFGTEKKLNYHVTSACEICKGLGATEFETCGTCEGQGGRIHQQGNMITQQVCGVCKGQGNKPKTFCGKCAGKGMFEEEKILTIVIPKGIANGANLRLVGQGGRGFNEGPYGDMLLVVKINYPDLDLLSEKEKEQLKKLLSK